MISFKAVQSPQAAASYLQEAFTEGKGSTEYYANDRTPSEWGGQAIQFAGLQQGVPVDKEELVGVLSGRLRLPGGEEQQLGRVTQEGIQHRAGWDFTFSAPKSVSMMALPGGDERVIAAHDAAVDRALKFAEQHYAFARVTENRQTVAKRTGNLLYSKFQHETSRELDPQIHSHVVVANATFDKDNGRWYSLSNEGLVANRKVLDAVYKNELAHHLKALGYGIQWTKDGPELAGIDREQIERFSTRRQQIAEAVAEKFGKDIDHATHGQRQAATLATRSNKIHMDRSALIERWQETARDIGLDLADLRERADRAPAREMNTDNQVVTAVDKALRHLSEREMAFRETVLIRETLRFGRGDMSMDAFEQHVKGMIERGAILPAEHHETSQPGLQEQRPGPKIETDRFLTTARAIARETAIVRDMLRNQNSVAPIADLEAVKESLGKAEGVKLNAGQQQAAELVLTTTNRFVGIHGYAGTGKTTLLQQVKQAAEDAGYKIIGMAAGAKQADVLGRETGISSSTIARFLNAQRNGEKGLETRAQLWVVDEASQVSAHDMAEIMRHAEKAGAHVAFLGDIKQHQSVEAGPSFEQMIRGGMETARMTEIHRQKDAVGQEVVGQIAREEVTGKDVIAAMDRLKAAGQVVEVGGEDRQVADAAVKQRLAGDWVKLTQEGIGPERVAVVTATNKDRAEVNAAIREERKTAGQIGEGKTFETYQPLDMTRQEVKSVFAYREKSQAIEAQTGKAPVLVMRAEADYPTKGIQRGDYLRIDAYAAETNTLMVQNLSASTAKRQVINPAQNSKFSIYQVEQREFAAGDRVMFRRNDQELGLVNGVSGTVQNIRDNGQALVRTDHGKELSVDLGQYKHIDHAYAMTTYKVQGETVDKTLYHMSASSGVIGQRAFYVGVTRARGGTTIYTDGFEAASTKAAAAVDKTSALEQSRRDETAKARAEKSDTRKVGGDHEPRQETVPAAQATSHEAIPQKHDLARHYFGNLRLGEARSLAREIDANDAKHVTKPSAERGDGKVAEATIKAAAAHLSATEQAFRESRLLETAARFSAGKNSSSQLQEVIREMASNGRLLVAGHLEALGSADRFLTTPANQRIEREVIETMKRGSGQAQPIVHDQAALHGAIEAVDNRRGYRMAEAERNAVFQAMSSRDRYTGIDYRDGDSRNSSIAAIGSIGRYYGARVQGIAANASTARQLSRDAGVHTQSVHQFLTDARQLPGQVRQAIDRMRANVDANLAYRNQHPRAATQGWSEPGLVGQLLGQSTLVKDADGSWRKADDSDHILKAAEMVAERLMNRAEAAWEKWRINRVESAMQNASNPRQLHAAYSRALNMQARQIERAAKNMTRLSNGRLASLMRAFGHAAMLRSSAATQEMTRFFKVGEHKAKAGRMREYAGNLREQAGRLSDIGRGKQEAWVVADAHRVGVRETREIMGLAEKQGARVVFAGDSRDAQAIGAGRVFDQLARSGMQTAQLGQARWETDPMKGVAEKLEKSPAEAYKMLDQAGRVRETNTLPQTIARDYVAQGRKALVLAPSQAHRQEINNAVREVLREQGMLKGGREIQTLQPAGLSDTEKSIAGAYQVRMGRGANLALRAERDYAAHGILRGDVLNIERVDSRANTLQAINTRTGGEVTIQAQHTADMTPYRRETREFAPGDTVLFRRGDGKQGIQNNQLGTVEKIDAKAMHVFTEDGRHVVVDLDMYRNLDHGYALTQEMSQGRVAKETWQSIPRSEAGLEHLDRDTGKSVASSSTRGSRQFYGAVTSARAGLRIYTDDKTQAAEQIARATDKTTATVIEKGEAPRDIRSVQEWNAEVEQCRLATGQVLDKAIEGLVAQIELDAQSEALIREVKQGHGIHQASALEKAIRREAAFEKLEENGIRREDVAGRLRVNQQGQERGHAGHEHNVKSQGEGAVRGR